MVAELTRRGSSILSKRHTTNQRWKRFTDMRVWNVRSAPKIQRSGPEKKAEDCLQQKMVCKFIIRELGPGQIELPDKHGNIVLHYLAGATFPNMPVIHWLKE
jgi:hypothetical protein